MTYSVKEMFLTLQGEGANVGRAAIFCRFTGCNLWSGREADRATADCRFCDTDFIGTDGVGGGHFNSAERLAEAIARLWPRDTGDATTRFAVFTGGEPTLQLDAALVEALHRVRFEVAIETNGTLPVPAGTDWICVSPKAGTRLQQRRGSELKLVFPQVGAEPEQFEDFEFEHFYLQPMDGVDRGVNTEKAVRYCMEHPRWRLSLQAHKVLGIR
jgi:7-carboxy-7-deazaguanine synthase